MEMPVDLHQVHVRQEGGCGKTGHDTALLVDQLLPGIGAVVVQEFHEEAVQRGIVLQHGLQHREENRD